MRDRDAEQPLADAGSDAGIATSDGGTDAAPGPLTCPGATCEPGGTCADETHCACGAGYLGSGTSSCRAVGSVLTAGRYHTCAARADGKVSCWGSIEPAYSASPVNELANVLEIVTGEDYACARTEVGEVVCWGNNTAGQLGTGDQTDSRTPRKVPGLSAVTNMAANWIRTCVVDASQHAQCWGGAYGEGEPVLSPRMVPLEGWPRSPWEPVTPARLRPTRPCGAGARTTRASSATARGATPLC